MSTTATPPAPGWPAPAPPEPPRRRWPRWGGPALVAGAAATVVVAATVATAGGGHPATWDPRVAPIARFVEHDRGLRFTHPVPVHFLSTAAFAAQLGGPGGSGGGGGPSDAQEAAELRALGVAHGPLDLSALGGQADAASTVGYYDDASGALYVEGTAMTPYVRVTVAHELTHALQDQHLGLRRLDGVPADEQEAVTALIEGDATTVEDDYRATLGRADEASYEQEEAAAGAGSVPAAYPRLLADQGSLPYDLGPAFVDALLASGGEAAVNGAFARPPTTESEIADPSAYLAGARPLDLPAPPLPRGAAPDTALGSFGQVSLADVLGTRVGYRAWADVQGWQGDRSALYDLDGRTCVAIEVATTRPGPLLEAATAWAAALPGTGARATARPGGAELTSCDPGTAAVPPPPVRPSAYDGIAARAQLLDDVLRSDAPPPEQQAECAADGTVAALGVAAAVAYEAGDAGAPSDARVAAAEHTAVAACAPPGAAAA